MRPPTAAAREVELHRERVVMRRAVAGMRMAVNLPVSAYRGVAIRVSAEARRHRRARASATPRSRCRLCLREGDDVTAEWRNWGACSACRCWSQTRTACREPFERLGGCAIEPRTPRRRRRTRHQAAPAVDPDAPRGAVSRRASRQRESAGMQIAASATIYRHCKLVAGADLLAALQLQRAAVRDAVRCDRHQFCAACKARARC